MTDLKSLIREVPDFPKPGILFYDITTLLQDKQGLCRVTDAFKDRYANAGNDAIIGIEARGFIFASALAYALGVGFIPVRKPKKLPWETLKVSYLLEYGSDSLEMHKDAVARGQRVLIIDDLLATGGAAAAVAPGQRRRHYRGSRLRCGADLSGRAQKTAGRHLFAGQYDNEPHPVRQRARLRQINLDLRVSIAVPMNFTSCARFFRPSRWPTRSISPSHRRVAPKSRSKATCKYPAT
jgi:adenine phosphoribosyltransferase